MREYHFCNSSGSSKTWVPSVFEGGGLGWNAEGTDPALKE